jgi:hypothetical protein
VSAPNRIVDAEYRLLDGTLVARNKEQLLGGSGTRLFHPINLTETGGAAPNTGSGYPGVYTGTTADGDVSEIEDCDGCETREAGTRGQWGSANASDEWWTAEAAGTCGADFLLYCFSELRQDEPTSEPDPETFVLPVGGVGTPSTTSSPGSRHRR